MIVKFITVVCFTMAFHVVGRSFWDIPRFVALMGYGVSLLTCIGIVFGVFVASKLRK